MSSAFVVGQSLSHVRLFVTLWTAARQASLSFTISWSLLKAISSSVTRFSCPQSFPASGFFPVSRLFASGGQSIGASVSFIPVNNQGLFPLGLTHLISLLSKGLSRVFSSTTVRKHQFLGVQPSLWSNSHILHDYWKNHSFDWMDLCWQNGVSAF